MSADIITRLRAALDAEETAARAATQGEWVWSREFVTPPGYHHRTIGPLEPGDAAFIAAHDPAHVLADIAAKRKLLGLHRPIRQRSTGSSGSTIEDCAICDAYPAQYPCTTVRLLAEAYGITEE